MEFVYSNYTSSLETTTTSICSYLTGSTARELIDDYIVRTVVDSPSNFGALVRFDFIPQSGSLYLLEGNCPPGVCSDLTPYLDFNKFSNGISGSYNTVKLLTWDESNNYESIIYSISSSLSNNNISMSVEYRTWNTKNYYETTSDKEYLLSFGVKNRNKNIVESICHNKETFKYIFQSCSMALFPAKIKSFDELTTNAIGVPDVVIKNPILDNTLDMYFFDLDEITGSMHTPSSYYAERYVPSDIYNSCNVNMTSHAIWGTDHFYDITNYLDENNFQRHQPIAKQSSVPISSSVTYEVGSKLVRDEIINYSYILEQSFKEPIHSGLMSGTKIILSDDTDKNVESLVPGDKIKTYQLGNYDRLNVTDIIYDDRDKPSSSSLFYEQNDVITDLSFSESIQTVKNIIPSTFSNKQILNGKVGTTFDKYIFSKLESEDGWRFHQGYELTSSLSAYLPDITGSSHLISCDMENGSFSIDSGSFTGYKILLDGVDYYHDHYFFNCRGLAVLEF